MITFLTKLFTRRDDDIPPYFHTHLDDHGRPYLCDESFCSPRAYSVFGDGRLLPRL